MMAGLIVGATISLWQKEQEVFFRASEGAKAQQDVRVGLLSIVRDLRQAKGIIDAGASRIVFQSAADPDPAPRRTFDFGGGTGCATLCVRYDRGGGAGSQVIADDILGLQFTYRDTNDNVLVPPLSDANRLLVRQVDVQVRGQANMSDPDPPFAFSSSVTLRNR